MKTKWFLSDESAKKYAVTVLRKFMDEFCAITNGSAVFDTDMHYAITQNGNAYDVNVVSDTTTISIGSIIINFRWNHPRIEINDNYRFGDHLIDYGKIAKVDTAIDPMYLKFAREALNEHTMLIVANSLANSNDIANVATESSNGELKLRIKRNVSTEKIDSRYLAFMKLNKQLELSRDISFAGLDISKITTTMLSMNDEITRKETEIYDGYQNIVDSVGGAVITLDGKTRILCHTNVRPSLGTHIVFKCPYTGNLEAIKAEYKTISFSGIDTLSGRALLG